MPGINYPYCSDGGGATTRRQCATTGELNNEVRVPTLRSHRIPIAIRRRWKVRVQMLELRDGRRVRSIDVIRENGGTGNTEAIRCGQVAERRHRDGQYTHH
jgi:hypothetical protein